MLSVLIIVKDAAKMCFMYTCTFIFGRGMHRKGFTGAHVDNVYMSWGTHELYTMWTPFDDVTVEMGSLAMCDSSCSLPRYRTLVFLENSAYL